MINRFLFPEEAAARESRSNFFVVGPDSTCTFAPSQKQGWLVYNASIQVRSNCYGGLRAASPEKKSRFS